MSLTISEKIQLLNDHGYVAEAYEHSALGFVLYDGLRRDAYVTIWSGSLSVGHCGTNHTELSDAREFASQMADAIDLVEKLVA